MPDIRDNDLQRDMDEWNAGEVKLEKWKEKIAAANASREWDELGGAVIHTVDSGWVIFGCPNSQGDPTLGRCEVCGQCWRKVYGWVAGEPGDGATDADEG